MIFRATFLLIVFGSLAGSSFAECKYTLDQNPTVIGLRFGMDQSEVNSAIRGLGKVKIKQDGHYSYFKTKLKDKRRGNFTGLRSVFLRFYDKKLYQFEFFFHENRYPKEVSGFVEKFASENAFPSTIFKFEHGYAVAECVGFTVKADVKLNPHITFTENKTAEKAKENAPGLTNLLDTD